MADPTYVTLVARVTIAVDGSLDRSQAERSALAQARSQAPTIPWTVEHVETSWGT